MIYGTRLRLRAPEREDIPFFVRWLNNPEVRQGLLHYLPMSQVEEQAWFERMLQRPADEHPLTIDIKIDGGWRAIGNCAFFNIDWRVRSAEIGILVGEKEFWNQGYGTEAMQLYVQHGFGTLNLNRIALDVYANNLRAIRCYEKAGFKHEGVKREAMYKDGKYIDVLIMSVLRRDLENKINK
jgi:diamine N-acetyltransferase